MTSREKYRWRKATDINREYVLFELLENETPILDVGFSDEEILEIAFNPSIAGKIIRLAQFLDLLEDGKALAERDLGEERGQ